MIERVVAHRAAAPERQPSLARMPRPRASEHAEPGRAPERPPRATSRPSVRRDLVGIPVSDPPAEWDWARSHWGHLLHEANCGIVGGSNVDLIRYYARGALDVVLNPRYAVAREAIPNGVDLNTIIEQFMLSAYLEFHRYNPDSPFKGVYASYLFPSEETAFNPDYAARLGFTHMLADAKSNARVARRLEEWAEHEDLEFYWRCVELGA